MVVDDLQPFVQIPEGEKPDARVKLKDKFKRLSDWLRFYDASAISAEARTPEQEQKQETEDQPRPGLVRRLSRKVVPGLPRAPTFKRRLSEQRERLKPHEPSQIEPRVISLDRRRAVSCAETRRPASPPPPPLPSDVDHLVEKEGTGTPYHTEQSHTSDSQTRPSYIPFGDDAPLPQVSPPISDGESSLDDEEDTLLEEELQKKWILNLSMHFRDRSDREKFFVTYAETPTRWRRLTISCDYRDAPSDSLEQDLKALRYQRDKSARIYEAIRESLNDIQYFDTVTNLKLQTSDGRLHVHVTEDLNEIISYPPASAVKHLGCPIYKENSLQFDSHLSGFVYKVSLEGRVFIKKEIPSPDVVDEFLYELNALHALRDSQNVIRFGGVVVDDEEQLVKGILIDFAERGPLTDILYDEKGRLAWATREKWARQIVQGLSEIHEAGFVQGDFTLSNIVIDGQNNAKIIDINRRGCPVGWEPPEARPLIDNNQKISMYIGVKSDLFQLGMVLWALGMQNDEPENQPRPLCFTSTYCSAPIYFQALASICLSELPRDRIAAKELLNRFPDCDGLDLPPMLSPREGGFVSSAKQYIDPVAAVEREDLDRFRESSASRPYSWPETTNRAKRDRDGSCSRSYPSSATGYCSSITCVLPRGRTTEAHRVDTLTTAPDTPDFESAVFPCVDDGQPKLNNEDDYDVLEEPQIVSVSPTDERRWKEIVLDGHPYLINRSSLDLIKENELDAKPVEAVL